MADITDKLADLSKRAVKLRDKDGMPWHEVAGELETSVGKAMLAYEFGKVKPADRVDATPANVKRLRDKEKLSWGRISARTGQGEAHCRALYEEATQTSALGNRIGKGGRYPGSTGKSPRKAGGVKKAPAKKSAAAKKAPAAKKATGARKSGGAAKKATGAKKVAKKASSATGRTATSGSGSLADMNFDEISARLEGRRIRVQTDAGLKTLSVKSVKSLDGDNLSFIDAKTSNTRTVKVSTIKGASK